MVKYLHPADRHPARVRKDYKDFPRKLDFKDIRFPANIDIFTKLEKRTATGLAFFVMKTRKNIQSISQ